MDQKTARAAVAKALKAGGFKARKGHLRREAGDLFWYADVRAASPAPTAALTIELGCWLPSVGPEPEGGAVDCPLLADVPVEGDPGEAASALVEMVSSVTDVATLRERLAAGALPGALVDRSLRKLLG